MDSLHPKWFTTTAGQAILVVAPSTSQPALADRSRDLIMTVLRTNEYLTSLVREFCKLPQETEWLEFKANNADPQQIGEYISALANSAVIAGKAFAYLLWGIDDQTHAIVGTDFRPAVKRVGNQELESWLLQLLTPKIHFRFYEVAIDEHRVVLLEIERAARTPVLFKNQPFIRVGTYKKSLREYPEKERALWREFERTPFEEGIAAERLGDTEALALLDYPTYFDLVNLPLPENRRGILEALTNDRLIRPCPSGGWSITNLGAILFAKRLEDFRGLRRKAIRVVNYLGSSRIESVREQVGTRGYASEFERVIDFVNGLLPSNEVIEQALRRRVPMYPEPAVRELIANALIHQDFSLTGTGPMVEIFSDRIEITNPGAPLMNTDRFVDTPPRSRNEALASLLRRMGICEERGSGWDKVVFHTEAFQLPAPLAEVAGDNTRVVLFAPRVLAKMDRSDRVRAVYLHACLRCVQREYLTNSSVRQRFRIEPQNIAAASRLIAEAVEAGVIVPDDPHAAPKLRRYVPFWVREG